MKDFYGDSTRWFIGVVKNLNDPIKMGRVQVRIHGVHGEDLEQVPDEKLPWAQVLTPVTEGGVANLGNFLGIQKDARVFGIFLDGKNSQMPMVMGSLPHSVKAESDAGRKTEVTTNVNAQGTTADTESVDRPVDKIDLESDKEEQEIIDEPQQTNIYKPEYPHNKVTQTTSGHIIEIDDTPDAQRIHIYHKSGTFIEMQPNGDVVTQHANGFRSVTGNDKLYASGDVIWNVEGDITFSSLKNISFNAKKDFNVITEGVQDYSSKGNVIIRTEADYTNTNNYTYISGSNGMDLRGSTIDLNKGGVGTPSIADFEWAQQEEPKSASAGGASVTPTDDSGKSLGPSKSGGGPMKGAHKTPPLITEPGDCTRKDLGSTSAKYESNGDPGAISGEEQKQTDGYSYGQYQISTKPGTFGRYMDYLKSDPKYSKYYTELNNSGGTTAASNGTTEFKNKWRNLAQEPDFAQSQHDFIQRSHHDRLVKNLKASSGIDICDGTWSNGVQDAIWSTSVQHGPGREWPRTDGKPMNGGHRVIENAIKRSGKTAETITDEELIKAIYAERGASNGMKYFPGSKASIRSSIVDRYEGELKDTLANSAKPEQKIDNAVTYSNNWHGLNEVKVPQV